ncbi:transmembrane protein 236 [Mugil cephalus]|uniref:transmembrane protein 236 n=1 Tax=Mugil cephalus TaxID=48193 RepID=UPI001FB5D60B|nr:transmembrane protein 236 [Mugil cephalus]
MPSGKTIKLVAYELLQFAALIVPVFVTMERFARLMSHLKGGDHTAYWLVVAASIAYMTSATLLVWAPLKYLILRRRRFITEITQWRPTALAYLVLSTLPCFGVLIASSKVQVDNGLKFDHFVELPVSLVLVSLICVDIVERIRLFRLRGKSDGLDSDFDFPGPLLTHLEQVSTISSQLHSDAGQNGLTQEPRIGSSLGRWQDPADSPRQPPASPQAHSTTYLYSSVSRRWSYSDHKGFLWRRDERSEVFVDTFLFWLDTVEMLRVAGEPSVFYSVWVFPVYVFTFLSTLRVIITPHSPLLSFFGVALQDFPFFVLRLALAATFGFVTPVLYMVKNIVVSVTFIYFTFLAHLRIFGLQSLF